MVRYFKLFRNICIFFFILFEFIGHSFLCLQIQFDDLANIMKHLIIGKVKVYDKHLIDDNDYKILRNAQDSIYGINYLTRTQSLPALHSHSNYN